MSWVKFSANKWYKMMQFGEESHHPGAALVIVKRSLRERISRNPLFLFIQICEECNKSPWFQYKSWGRMCTK
jgi:hypothetical protein